MNHFTTEDMIRFLYNEMSPEETQQMTAALESDWILREQYEALKASMKELDTVRFSPRMSSIDRIMQYAAEQESMVTDKG